MSKYTLESPHVRFLPASLFRRCAALLYDSFIVFSLLLLLTAIALLANHGQSLLRYRMFFLMYLFLATGLFLSGFWCKRGQTLGMLAWKLQVLDKHNRPLTWSRAWLRYVLSFLNLCVGGVGLLWCFVGKDQQSLHDSLAGTKMIMILKNR
jgi:uncharacterized RDD family membrane protein YckC